MNYKLLALIVLLAIFFFGSREGFVDFGLSGWSKPVENFNVDEVETKVDLSQFKRELTDIAPSDLSKIIDTMTAFMQNKTGKCLTPIETIYVNKYSGPQGEVMYDNRVMFYDTKHFFVTEVMSKLLKNDNDSYTVASMRTQVPSRDVSGPAAMNDDVQQMSTFVDQDELLTAINPSKSGMEAVLKALSKNTKQE